MGISSDGFAIVQRVFEDREIDSLAEALARASLSRSRAGARHAMSNPVVANLARDVRLMNVAQEVLGPEAVPFRATLFDKSPVSGPLRVLRGTHREGVLTDEAVQLLAQNIAPVDCLVRRGGVLAMRPLLIHASSKSRAAAARRVLHVEYAASMQTEQGLELAVA
jgi:hypothetical protein